MEREIKLKIVDKISSKGDGEVNEDTWGVCGNCFWVIDGVTSKTQKKFYSSVSDAEFLVNIFSEKLVDCCKINSQMSNRDLMHQAMLRVRNNLNKITFDENEKSIQPSFAIAIVKINSGIMEIDVLSDCYVIMKHKRKIFTYTDSRINVIVEKTKKVREFIAQNNIKGEQAIQLLTNQKLKNRELMNMSKGYWVGTIDGKAFDNTYSKKISLRDVDEVLLCTDGFYKIFEKDICTPQDIFEEKISLKSSVNILREYEKHNAEVGMKISDDATAVRIILS